MAKQRRTVIEREELLRDAVFRSIVWEARRLMWHGGDLTKDTFDQLDRWCDCEQAEVMAGPVYDRIVQDYNFAFDLLVSQGTKASVIERRWKNGEFWFSNYRYTNETVWTNENGFIVKPGPGLRSSAFLRRVRALKFCSAELKPLGVYNGMWLEKNPETGEVYWETKHRTD
jgi:hypothetical protein